MGPMILVVDDHPGLRATLAELLGDFGYGVAEAPDGREALRLLRNGLEANLILLDLAMPGMSGWEFLREWREDQGLQHIPVLVVSASVTQSTVPLGQDGQPVLALTKPVNIPRLISEIAARTCEPPPATDAG